MTQKTTFLFDTDFGNAEAHHIYDQDEMEIACRQSYVEGMDAGRAQTLLEIESQTLQTLRTLSSYFSHLEAIEKQSYKNACMIAEEITKVLLPEFAKREGLEELTAIVEDVLNKLNSDNKLIISCAEPFVEPLQKYFKDPLHSMHVSVPIEFRGMPNALPTDIKMDWGTGFAQRNESILLEKITTYLTQYKEINHVAG